MKKLTTSEFIDRARAVHGDRYDYTLVEYKGRDVNVNIICSVHGLFQQSPHNHQRGAGCSKCGNEFISRSQSHTLTQFIEKANVVHNNTYNYDFVSYVNAKTKIIITCIEHGNFDQTPDKHLSGNGCPLCRGNKISTSKTGVPRKAKSPDRSIFINKAITKHKNKYDYDLVEYTNAYSKVKIICKYHGIFEQTPTNHLSGKGCSSCAEYGFNRKKNGYLYLLRSECGRYCKIGITNKPDQRHAQLSRATPFPFECIELIKGRGDKIANIEKELLADYQPVKFDSQFDGYSEWRLWDDSIRHKLLTFMNEG